MRWIVLMSELQRWRGRGEGRPCSCCIRGGTWWGRTARGAGWRIRPACKAKRWIVSRVRGSTGWQGCGWELRGACAVTGCSIRCGGASSHDGDGEGVHTTQSLPSPTLGLEHKEPFRAGALAQHRRAAGSMRHRERRRHHSAGMPCSPPLSASSSQQYPLGPVHARGAARDGRLRLGGRQTAEPAGQKHTPGLTPASQHSEYVPHSTERLLL